MHKHKTDFASVLGYPTAGVNCFADRRLRGEMMGSLQEYLLGVVDDAGCKPYGCGKNAERELRGELLPAPAAPASL